MLFDDGQANWQAQARSAHVTDEAGFERSDIAFLTAYQDRQSSGFKKTMSGLAWGSFAWFASEPDKIVILWDGAVSSARLSELTSR